MRLSTLLDGLGGGTRSGPEADPEVVHLALDSRRVRPGSLFVALTGRQADGRAFVPAALAAGAVAVLSDGEAPGEVGVPWLHHPAARSLVGRLVVDLHPDLFGAMQLVAVTGTKGKTTTSRLLASVLTAAGRRCGSVGTLGWADSEGRGEAIGNTTPDASRLAEVLRELRESGHRAVALEASSQAGVQARLRHLPLAGLGFLNLSPEHAELHPTMDAYREAKAQLFRDAAAVTPDLVVAVPLGDADGEAMVRAAGSGARVLRFGEGAGAAVRGRVRDAGLAHLELELDLEGVVVQPRLRVGGLFNLQNACCAAALAHGLGVDAEAVAAGLAAAPPPRGRFEVLERGGVHAMVDYAHSADSLEKLLQSCRQLVGAGRLLVVFGCGGKKDRAKRPRMGGSAAAHADLVWVTNDNPRGEDPAAIAADVLAGLPAGTGDRVRVELDRRAAIREALAEARAGDLVVVAGKGHETVQELGDRVIAFDDRAEILAAWASGECGSGGR